MWLCSTVFCSTVLCSTVFCSRVLCSTVFRVCLSRLQIGEPEWSDELSYSAWSASRWPAAPAAGLGAACFPPAERATRSVVSRCRDLRAASRAVGNVDPHVLPRLLRSANRRAAACLPARARCPVVHTMPRAAPWRGSSVCSTRVVGPVAGARPGPAAAVGAAAVAAAAGRCIAVTAAAIRPTVATRAISGATTPAAVSADTTAVIQSPRPRRTSVSAPRPK
jgi:hypothetical protein